MSLYKFQEYQWRLNETDQQRNLTEWKLVEGNAAQWKSLKDLESILGVQGLLLRDLELRVNQSQGPDLLPDYEYDTLLERIDNFERQYRGALNWVHNKISLLENETLIKIGIELESLKSRTDEGKQIDNAHTQSINDIKGRLEAVFDELESNNVALDYQNRTLEVIVLDLESLQSTTENLLNTEPPETNLTNLVENASTKLLDLQDEIQLILAQIQDLNSTFLADRDLASTKDVDEPAFDLQLSIIQLNQSYDSLYETMEDLKVRLNTTEERLGDNSKRLEDNIVTVKSVRENVLRFNLLPRNVSELREEVQNVWAHILNTTNNGE